MPLDVPIRQKVITKKTYSDISVTQNLPDARGIFILSFTDSSTPKKRWEIIVDGGYKGVGDRSKYIIQESDRLNVNSVSPTVYTDANWGLNYTIVTTHGDTYLLTFNPAEDKLPTIRRTVNGGSFTQPVQARVLFFS